MNKEKEDAKRAKMRPENRATHDQQVKDKLMESYDQFSKTISCVKRMATAHRMLAERFDTALRAAGHLASIRTRLSGFTPKSFGLDEREVLLPALRDYKAEALFEIVHSVKEHNEKREEQNRALTSLVREAGVQNEYLKELLLEARNDARDAELKYREERRNRILMTWLAILGFIASIVMGVASLWQG